MGPRPPLAAVATLSAAALAYEVLLLRLFAIIQWHHFAWLAISVALLGFGAAGTFVTLARRRLLALYPASFSLAAAAFGVAAVACFAAAARVPFNALELAWQPGEFLGLAAIYALLLVPFFCAATALAIAYAGFGAWAAWGCSACCSSCIRPRRSPPSSPSAWPRRRWRPGRRRGARRCCSPRRHLPRPGCCRRRRCSRWPPTTRICARPCG